MADERSTAVVVVNYRTPELTARAVASVLGEADVSEVIVVDNSAAELDHELVGPRDPRVKVVPARSNLGFGGGVNLGARHASASNIFVLNSDARLLPGGIGPIVDRLGDRSIGIVAPHVMDEATGELQPDVFGSLPTPATFIRRRNVRPVPTERPGWVSGVAFGIRAETFSALGGFDERFHMYFEDVDLCRRARKGGLEVVRTPAASVTHQGGASQSIGRDKYRRYLTSQDQYLRAIGTPTWQHLLFRACRLPTRLGRAFTR